MAKIPLGELLVKSGVIDEPALRHVLQLQFERRAPVGRLLIEEGYIREQVLVQALASQLEVSSVDLEARPLAPECARFLTFEQVLDKGMLVFGIKSRALDVAMLDPTSTNAIHELQTRTMMAINPFLIGPEGFASAVEQLYAKPVPLTHRVVGVEERLNARIRQLEDELARAEMTVQELKELCIDSGVEIPQSLLDT